MASTRAPHTDAKKECAWVDKNRHEVRKVTHCLSTANIPNCCAFCQCVKCTKRDASAGGEHVRHVQHICLHTDTHNTHPQETLKRLQLCLSDLASGVKDARLEAAGIISENLLLLSKQQKFLQVALSLPPSPPPSPPPSLSCPFSSLRLPGLPWSTSPLAEIFKSQCPCTFTTEHHQRDFADLVRLQDLMVL
jgi:hypothetical protein